MEMNEVIGKLQELQTVLAEKYSLEKKIEETPKQLDSQEELLARLKKEYIEKNSEYNEIKGMVERLKGELVEVEARQNNAEKGMDSITTHREYEALDKEITEASGRAEQIRAELKQREKRLSEVDEVLHSQEALISSTEANLEESRRALAEQIDGYKGELAGCAEREGSIVPGIDQEIIYKFQRIIKRNADGIVAVKNGVCTGCHMILPAQFANEVHDGEKILFCPYCSRILFYEEAEDGEQEDYAELDETGSLSDYEGDEEEAEEEDGEDTPEDDMDDDKSTMGFGPSDE